MGNFTLNGNHCLDAESAMKEREIGEPHGAEADVLIAFNGSEFRQTPKGIAKHPTFGVFGRSY
jgi:hypothetical protein